MSTGSDDATRVEQVPTCYRHPDRETYVRCQRCERPICPDCMREAAVGFQCVECVTDGHRGTRAPRTLGGARAGTVRTAVLTWTLVGVNVLVFIAQLADPTLLYRLAMNPLAVAAGQWWRPLTAAFLHSQSGFYLHIVFNMWALIVLGPQLERTLGRARFGALYILSALAGSALVYWVAGMSSLTIGASGAIFGLFGATFVLARRLRLNTTFLVVIIVFNLVLTFSIPGISWGAHVGGLAAGVALSAAYVYAPAHRRVMTHVVVTAGVAVVIVVAMLVQTMLLRSGVPGW